MAFDLAQFLTALLFWGTIAFILGAYITWAMMTGNPQFLAWIQFHLPWAYSFFHIGVVCPNGFSCVKN